MNFLTVEVGTENGSYHARREGFDTIVTPERSIKAAGRGEVIMGIRPEDVTMLPAAAGEGVLGDVYVVEPLGRDDLVDVHIGDASVHVLADPSLNVKISDPVRLSFNPEKVQFFDPGTEDSLLWA
jgi:ABC-type sugar transport system ATPase subunit